MSLVPPQEQVVRDTKRLGKTKVRLYAEEIARLRGVVRSLYTETLETEDMREFILGVRGGMGNLIESWGETPTDPVRYMEEQRIAEARRRDEEEFDRLRRKLSK